MEKHDNQSKVELVKCGILGGVVQAVVFNFFDRALYLSMKNSTPFLDRNNFREPMAGVLQTISQRALSSGLYFPLEDIFSSYFATIMPVDDRRFHPLKSFLSGTFAGAANGILLNPLTSVKYKYWGEEVCGKENFRTTAASMFKKGGLRPFCVGASATVARDTVFGGIFSCLRNGVVTKNIQSMSGVDSNLSGVVTVVSNIVSGCAATIVSSPLNYVRNVHYATPPDRKVASGITILKSLWHDSKNFGLFGRVRYLQSRLLIGWGTARVGLGMALTSYIYGYFLDKNDNS